ncbi:PASTA domain-containing protein [Demequina capsici]|uniref:PASTA domain-containing protein n=1 Tax=Demequina capsici TaxID=3075620 RepID=A0AA96F6V9_9MICO|nr:MULTISPECIES: PASTA domain-containing protein [unclassified Demequina]WNM24394.1 PASTA domain-containing protein [Demequina sp. OYTSA14]WNM27214.1 PASTA domain-containing protein [Demequina sp. PMTSA13]
MAAGSRIAQPRVTAAGVGVALAAVVFVVVVTLGWYFAPKIVPSVTGLSVDDAVATLADHGISVRVDPSASAGVVIDERPIAGERWSRGEPFVLTYTLDGRTYTNMDDGSSE